MVEVASYRFNKETMKSGDIYYNPKENKIIEFLGEFLFEICGVDIPIYNVHDRMGRMIINGEEIDFPQGPILGILKHDFKGWYKIGTL